MQGAPVFRHPPPPLWEAAMGKKDKRIDAYIARKPEFARPILAHLRAVVHAACPDVQESLKWGMPAFEYHGLLCSMAAFKQHTTFGFWKGKLIVDANGQDLESAMGQFGRITSVKELPAKRVLAGYVKKAMALNEAGTTVKRTVKPKPALRMPADFKAALAQRAARLPRVGAGGQAGGHAREAHRHGGGLDRRGEATELEVREMLAGEA
jgi:hypothetical protein